MKEVVEDPSFVFSLLDIPESPSHYLLSEASSESEIPDQLIISTEWTRNENKLFENAIAELDINSSDLFVKIASKVPGKTIEEIEKHYWMLVKDIETIECSDSFPVPDYVESKIMNHDDDDGDSSKIETHRKKGKASGRRFRRKGIPWTEEEHSLFLAGLSKYGKGDWRSISRHYVISRTPTQVASHAQKYYLRLNSRENANYDHKRRSSILDTQESKSMKEDEKLTMSGNNDYRPIAASPFPLSPPAYNQYYDFAGTSTRSVLSQANITSAGAVCPVMNSSSTGDFYGYNMKYPAQGPTVIRNLAFNCHSTYYFPHEFQNNPK